MAKTMQKAQLELSIEGRRLYIRALGNNAVSVKLDVTPLWQFFKETMAYSKRKKRTKLPKPTDADYEDYQASQ